VELPAVVGLVVFDRAEKRFQALAQQVAGKPVIDVVDVSFLPLAGGEHDHPDLVVDDLVDDAVAGDAKAKVAGKLSRERPAERLWVVSELLVDVGDDFPGRGRP
jgi:hypothetical protein